MSSDFSVSAATMRSLWEAPLLWRARHLAPSAYLDHLSFLFWLVSDLKPSRIVGVEGSEGTAYFAACQAVDQLGLDTTCLAFCTVEDEDRQAALEAQNAEHYADFSTLAFADTENAADQITAGSVDLLILERFPSTDVLGAFEEAWLPRLSSRAVLLIPGFADPDLDKASADRLATLRGTYPSVSFSHGRGLDVLMIGSAPPPRLADLSQTTEHWHSVQRFFERISELHVLKAARDRAEEASRGDRAWAMRLKSEKETLSVAYQTRHEAAARLQAELFDRRSEVVELRNRQKLDRVVSHQSAEGIAEQTAALKTALEGQKKHNEALRGQIATLQKDHADTVRYYRDEIAAMASVNEAQARRLIEIGGAAGQPSAADLKALLRDRFEEIAALTRALEAQLEET